LNEVEGYPRLSLSRLPAHYKAGPQHQQVHTRVRMPESAIDTFASTHCRFFLFPWVE